MAKNKRAAPTEAPPSWFRRLKFLGIIVMVALLGGLFVNHPLIWVTSEDNGEWLAAGYRFAEEDFNHPKLRRLREREKLDSVVAAGRTQFEKAVLLRGWVRRQWESQIPFYYPPWDALEILDLARSGKSRGFCAQYAIVFVQACQALGIHARYVELHGHFAAAIWSDDLDRWIFMDPTNDVHFERDGKPMRGRDLSAAYWHGQLQGIERVAGDGSRRTIARDDLSTFQTYAIVELANQLSMPAVVQVGNEKQRTLTHEDDYRRYPVVGRDRLSIVSAFLEWRPPYVKGSMTGKPESADRDDFRYAMNQTILVVARRSPDRGVIKLLVMSENSPSLANFELQADGQPWKPMSGHEILWTLHSGSNRLSARVKTRDGWYGPVSQLDVFYKPSWMKR